MEFNRIYIKLTSFIFSFQCCCLKKSLQAFFGVPFLNVTLFLSYLELKGRKWRFAAAETKVSPRPEKHLNLTSYWSLQLSIHSV